MWGSGLDTTLTRIRDVLNANTTGCFPVSEVEAAMGAAGKSLSFDPAEIDELLNLKYAGQRTFPVLSVLYPGLDLSKKFHEDHIFPKSSFTRKRLAAAGIPAEKIDDCLETVNLLPNLQLLPGTVNIEKQATLPADWIGSETVFPIAVKRETYLHEKRSRRTSARPHRLSRLLQGTETEDQEPPHQSPRSNDDLRARRGLKTWPPSRPGGVDLRSTGPMAQLALKTGRASVYLDVTNRWLRISLGLRGRACPADRS